MSEGNYLEKRAAITADNDEKKKINRNFFFGQNILSF